MTDKPRVLHIAADFPNVYRPVNTLAVHNFIDLNPALDHHVYAVTRTGDPRKADLAEGDGQGRDWVTSVRYWGLPGGVNLPQSMTVLADRIHKHMRESNIRADLIHAHKLTFEGIAARRLAQKLGIPYVCSARGEAETKTLKYLPMYNGLFRKTAHDAQKVYLVSAWVRNLLKDKLHIDDAHMAPLPNFVHLPNARTAFHFHRDRLLCLAHLEVYEKKGVPELLEALARVSSAFPEAHIDIFGRTPPEDVAAVEALIERLGLQTQVSIAGQLDHAQLMQRLPDYAAMVLASKNETFGMSYAEALYSGVPILYSQGTGIDGFVDGINGAVAADPFSVDSIEAALRRILSEQQELRSWLINNIADVRKRFEPAPFLEDYNQLARHAARKRIAA